MLNLQVHFGFSCVPAILKKLICMNDQMQILLIYICLVYDINRKTKIKSEMKKKIKNCMFALYNQRYKLKNSRDFCFFKAVITTTEMISVTITLRLKNNNSRVYFCLSSMCNPWCRI